MEFKRFFVVIVLFSSVAYGFDASQIKELPSWALNSTGEQAEETYNVLSQQHMQAPSDVDFGSQSPWSTLVKNVTSLNNGKIFCIKIEYVSGEFYFACAASPGRQVSP